MNFLIGQIISILCLIISCWITQFKNVRYILLGEIVANLLMALSFVFFGGLSGAWICIVSTVQTVVLYWVDKKEIEDLKRMCLLYVFMVAYVMGTFIVYQGWNDIISCICALLYSMAITQKKAKNYRTFMILNSSVWVIYDFNVAAYINIITHGMVLVSGLIAKLRLDWSKNC